MKKKVLVILGSTATGKTDVALQLAKQFQGEMVSADSRQVYKDLDIGTGKLPGKDADVKRGDGFWEMDGVKVWMYDVVDPNIRYTVADYVEQASKVIEDILNRGKLPIIVGGTGLYVRAITEGLPNLEIPTDEKLRGELEKLTVKELQKKLQALSPTSFASLNNSDRNNPRRLLRSLEMCIMYPHITTTKNLKFKIKNYNLLKVGLTAPREVLQARISTRLNSRIDQGLISEVEKLYENGLTLQRMKELGLEYGMLARLLNNEISENQMISELSVKISQYAKRQMTWFKKVSDISWFDITDKNYLAQVEKLVGKWYYQDDDQKD